jgi:hypothetical protein
MSEIKAAIREIVGMNQSSPIRTFDAEVTSAVNDDTRTCDVVMIGGKSSNTLTVRVMASVDDGALFYPVVGSTVIVTMSDFVEPYISMYSEIEKIVWLGGENGGVPLAKELTTKIKALEDLLNDLITKYNSHVHVTTCSAGSGTATATTSLETQSITQGIQQSDIEHPNITH